MPATHQQAGVSGETRIALQHEERSSQSGGGQLISQHALLLTSVSLAQAALSSTRARVESSKCRVMLTQPFKAQRLFLNRLLSIC